MTIIYPPASECKRVKMNFLKTLKILRIKEKITRGADVLPPDSRISHLNKIGQMVRLLCLANLLIGVTNTFSGASLAWLNLLCATFLAYGLGRISSKRENLVEERQLHE